jgi:hypothetical protein
LNREKWGAPLVQDENNQRKGELIRGGGGGGGGSSSKSVCNIASYKIITDSRWIEFYVYVLTSSTRQPIS